MSDRTLIATTPAALEAAQSEMIDWCIAKLHEVGASVRELRDELRIAKKNHWRQEPIKRRIRTEGKRLHFYAKIRRALRAGYYVVPNFAAQAFAIRTDRSGPRFMLTHYSVSRHEFDQRGSFLPAKAGRYVSATPTHRRIADRVKKLKDGTESRTQQYRTEDWQDVEFPIALMKPAAMDATAQAMALGVFDEIAETRDFNLGGDPMVLGVIRNPRRGRPNVTFFIASVMPLERI